jgi:hypothetical protein
MYVLTLSLFHTVPNDWPHIEELYNTSSTSFNVSWSPLNNMSYVQGFKIYFTSLTQWNVVNVSKHVFHAEIKGLEILTTYMVSVGAYSMEGDGLPSPIRSVTTDEWSKLIFWGGGALLCRT